MEQNRKAWDSLKSFKGNSKKKLYSLFQQMVLKQL